MKRFSSLIVVILVVSICTQAQILPSVSLLSACKNISNVPATKPKDIKKPSWPLMFPGRLSIGVDTGSATSRATSGGLSFDQGLTAFRIHHWTGTFHAGISVSGGYKNDKTKTEDWRNRLLYGFGFRLMRGSKHGALTFTVDDAHEYRFNSGLRAHGLRAYVDFYYAWDQITDDERARKSFFAFPRGVSGVFGLLSPVEKGDIYAIGSAYQGVALRKIGPTVLAARVEYTLAQDSKRYDWNNSHTIGLSFELSIPRSLAKLAFTCEREMRPISGHAFTGCYLSVKKRFFWF